MPSLPFANSYDFDTFTTFEDPFSYSVRPYDEAVPNPDPEPSTPEQLDNKLLGFSAPVLKMPLIDDAGQYAEIGMTAELYGMFFVAEDVFAAGETTGRPLELTCYRRNLWQCSGQITLARGVSHLIDEGGNRLPVQELAASITAVESIDGKPTEIISIPWKSASASSAAAGGGNAGGSEESKVASAPPNVALDLAGSQDVDGAGRATLPVAWKRLQFKHATANNGRRKGLQQHYVVQISLLAKAKGAADFVSVAEVQSGPVIVRGRSPRNFDSRRDVPLMGGGGGERRVERRGTNASEASVKAEPVPQQQQQHQPQHQQMPPTPNMRSFHNPLGKPGIIEWPQPYTVPNQGAHPAKRLAASSSSPNTGRPAIPAWSSAKPPPTPSPHVAAAAAVTGRPAPSVPLSLSLSEDERSPGRSSAGAASPQFAKGAGGAAKAAVNARQSPVEEVDMLYEYFPLSVDDWYVPLPFLSNPPFFEPFGKCALF